MTKETNQNANNGEGSAENKPEGSAAVNPEVAKLQEELKAKDRLIQEQGTTIQTFKKRSEELGGPVGGGKAPMFDAKKFSVEKDRIYQQMEDGEISVTEGNRKLDAIREQETEARIRAAQEETFTHTTGFLSFKEAVDRIKRENPEIVPFEDFITGRANDLLNGGIINPNTGQPYTPIEAAQSAVSSFKARFQGAAPKGPAQPGQPASGSQGEGGDNRPPVSPNPEPVVSDAEAAKEYVSERQAQLNRIKNPTYRGKM